MKNYKQADLKWIEPLASEATQLMNQFIIDTGLKDGGTCVMGECIEINVVPPRCRLPKRHVIVHQPFQGNNQRALRCAMDWLLSRGVECRYNCGRMD